MATTIIAITIALIVGLLTFFIIGSFVVEYSWRSMIVITVMITSYTLINEAISSRYTD